MSFNPITRAQMDHSESNHVSRVRRQRHPAAKSRIEFRKGKSRIGRPICRSNTFWRTGWKLLLLRIQKKVILLFPEMHLTFLFPLAVFTDEFSEGKMFSSKNNIKEREIFYFILSCSMYSLFSLMYSSENL